ncbi:MAG: TIGR02099 family protein [Burkholderiales bacterium]|nr:TIGR02099 family protein [Burkholderiales bacterium]
MHKTQDNSPHLRRRLGSPWRTARAVYRYINIATFHVFGVLFKLLVVGYFIFCGLLLSLRYGVLPNIDSYKPDVERLTSHALGRPVSIGRLEASWRGLRPQLHLTNVVIHDRQGQRALALRQVSAILAWESLLRLDLHLHQLEIVRPDMDIRRDVDGNLHVGGIFIDKRKSDDGKTLDWILSQREIVIREGRLRWNDGKRGAAELALDHVDFTLRNQWRRHRFGLRATPPGSFASPLDVRADFEHPYFSDRISDVTKWKGELYADMQNTDLTAWKAYVDYPIDVAQGHGSVRAWLNFDHARVADFTADLVLTNVSTHLGRDVQPLDLAQVNGRISVREELDPNNVGTPTFGARGHAIALKDFSFETKDGLVFPTTTLSESYRPATRNKPEMIELRAKLVDLHTLTDFAERLPLPAGQRKLLNDFLPRGRLKDFSVQWQGSYPELASYSIKGQFEELSLNAQAPRPARPAGGNAPAQAAVPGIPGFDNLTGAIDASDKGGSFSLRSADLKLNLPGYFGEPLMAFQRLNMQANWSFQKNDQLLLQVDHMDFSQNGVSGSLSGRHLMPLKAGDGTPLGQIDVVAKINEFDVQRVGNYLPVQTPSHLYKWLTGALQGGKAQNVTVRLKGELSEFPFQAPRPDGRPRGEFSVAGKIIGGKLNYVPDLFAKGGKAPLWPVAENIMGTIRFDRTRMEIRGDTAKTYGVDLKNVRAVIPDLLARDTQLEIDGEAEGRLQDMVRYANDSPVDEWIGHLTEETKASGNAKLALTLKLPLDHIQDAKVHGVLTLAGNDITLFDAMPTLQASSGKLEFDEKGVTLPAIKTNFVGAPATVTAATQRDGTVVIKAAGIVSADGVRKTFSGPAMQRVGQRLAGSTRYAATVTVKKKRRPEIVVESSLQGLALDLPSPVNKTSGESMPFKLEVTGATPSDAPVLRDEIKISLGSTIAAKYERQKSADRSAAWQVVRGGIGINVPAPQPDTSGVIANVSLRTLNIDAWNRFFASISTNEKAEANAAVNGLNLMQYIDPEVLAARATELIIGGKKLENVVVGASHQKGVWQANIDSEQASGYVTWYQSTAGRGLGRVTARLASLVIPKSAASDVTDLLEGKNTATQIPALDIVAENFELFGKRLGHLELIAYNAGTGAAREWRIGKLSMANADAELRATGKWANREGENVSSLNYTLDITDAGRLLERFGFNKLLRGGKGKMTGDLQWKGLPFSLDIPSLSGKFELNIGAGQFLKVDPSAAKLLGVLSLQSLPRRLALDFRDVFSEGFAFDGIVGTTTISNGIAKTDNFKMRGLSATVLLDGTADIARESTNLHVAVIPEVNAGAASVVYGLAVNPVIGLGTFLAQLFLREPLMKAFTYEYQVTGSWGDPVITKLDRNGENASGAAGAANAAASAERTN